jgi:hypothetical protein
MAKLLFTTSAFQPVGRATPGVPMLLDREMRLVEPACTWLLHIAAAGEILRSSWRRVGGYPDETIRVEMLW